MPKEKIDWRIVCTGLTCLTAAELYALYLGHNGTILKIFIVIIATAIGITIPRDVIINVLKGGK